MGEESLQPESQNETATSQSEPNPGPSTFKEETSADLSSGNIVITNPSTYPLQVSITAKEEVSTDSAAVLSNESTSTSEAGESSDIQTDSPNKTTSPALSPVQVIQTTAFSFLDAVREHRRVSEVERHRTGQNERYGRNSAHFFSLTDALKYSVMYGHREYCKYLLEHRLEESLTQTVCCPLLLLAVRLDQPHTVQLLCEYSGRKAQHRYYINKRGCSAMECGRTALHIATATGNIVITRLLLSYGANVLARDDLGHTPLCHLLYRLQQPHVTVRTVQCALELLKHKPTITRQELAALRNLAHTAVATNDNRLYNVSHTGLVPQDMTTGPGSLCNLSRIVIRSAIGYPRLPQGAASLAVPSCIQKYIAMFDA